MKKKFTTDYVLSLKTYQEFSKGYQLSDKKLILFLTILVIINVVIFLLGDYTYVLRFSLFSLIFIFIYYIVLSKNKIYYRRMLESHGGNPAHNFIIINEREILTEEKNSGNKNNYSFQQIIGILETTNQIILKLKYNLGLIIDKNNLNGGTKEELVDYLYSVCPNIKNKKIINTNKRKYFHMIYVLIFIILLLLSFGLKWQENYFIKQLKNTLEHEGYEVVKMEPLENFMECNIYMITKEEQEIESFIYQFETNQEANNNFQEWLSIYEEDFGIVDCEEDASQNYQKCEIQNQDYYVIYIKNGKYLFYSNILSEEKEELETLMKKIDYFRRK